MSEALALRIVAALRFAQPVEEVIVGDSSLRTGLEMIDDRGGGVRRARRRAAVDGRAVTVLDRAPAVAVANRSAQRRRRADGGRL